MKLRITTLFGIEIFRLEADLPEREPDNVFVETVVNRGVGAMSKWWISKMLTR